MAPQTIMINVISVDYVERDVCYDGSPPLIFAGALTWSPSDAQYGSMVPLEECFRVHSMESTSFYMCAKFRHSILRLQLL